MCWGMCHSTLTPNITYSEVIWHLVLSKGTSSTLITGTSIGLSVLCEGDNVYGS